MATELDHLAATSIRLHGSLGERLVFGRTESGEPLLALRLSRSDGSAQRPCVLLVGQQRNEEPASAEALLALARRLTQEDLVQVLDRIDVLLVPRLDPDGADAQRRAGPRSRIDTDHLALATVEGRSLAGLLRDFDPAVIISTRDLPAASPARLAIEATAAPGVAPFIARAAREWFRDPLARGLHGPDTGLPADPQGQPNPSPGALEEVGGLKNAVSLRVAMQPQGSDQGSATSLLATSLRLAAARADDLMKLRRYVDQEVAAEACRGELALDGTRPRPRPCAYWLAADAAPAAERLRMLGVEVVQLGEPSSALGSLYRQQPGGPAELVDALVDMPAGSYVVPMSQPQANLAAAALEPQSRQGFLDERVIPDLSQIARLRVPFTATGGGQPDPAKAP